MSSSETITIVFEPGGRQAQVSAGATVMDAAEAAGISVWAPCGRRGVCGQCRIRVADGDGCSQPSEAEVELLSPGEIEAGWRLGCQARVEADLRIVVPEHLGRDKGQVLESGRREDVPLAPNVVKRRLQLPAPSLEDPAADLRRIERALELPDGRLAVTRRLAAEVPSALRRDDLCITATVIGDSLVEVAGPDAPQACCGVAVDLGTTTVVAYLVDLHSGGLLATASAINPQAAHGADVMSRLDRVRQEPDALEAMHQAAVEVVSRLIAEACAEAGVEKACVYELTVVGNTCMHHLFLGLDPSNIAVIPFTPAVTRALSVPAAELGVDISPVGMTACLPNVSGYVGADIVGAIVAAGLEKRPEPTVMIDIGTNGEVVLWTGHELLCCSCAAGPAFEGAQINRGMRAAPGAIDHVACRDGDIAVSTIGEAEPVGLCGSGLVDAAAVLLDAGVLDSSGRLGRDGPGAGGMARRVVGDDRDRRFVLASDAESADGREIALTQRDVRQLQLASGAIRAGTQILFSVAGLEPGDISEFLLAGAFGSYIRPASALRIGLLPGVPEDRVRAVGNAAGMGAVLCLISTQAREYAAEVARQARYIELSTRPDFQDAFAEAMVFP
ncbi:MAG: ASKHA domain-containing protein [Armatimonadota bacterium]|jgi:uncharacterized 2Fe-2S/4Fe-4S cluster protein (DUF4445 family)